MNTDSGFVFVIHSFTIKSNTNIAQATSLEQKVSALYLFHDNIMWTEGVRFLSWSPVVNFLQARGTNWSTIPVMCLRFSDWPISIQNWVYIFHRVLSNPYSDVLCSEECQAQKLLAHMR